MADTHSISITQGSDNIFADLGFEAEEAASLKIRADLMLDLKHHIQVSGWTEAQTAEILGETSTRVNDLMNGEISQFTVDSLINLLVKVGMKVKIEVVHQAA